jgi:sporulation protein YlmC with PRC-barrel domain
MSRLNELRVTTGVLSAAALSAVLALAAPAGAADAPRNAANQQGATATTPAGSDMIKPDQMRASKVIGGTVYDRHNQKLGDVKDLILDKDGRVAAVVVGMGGVMGAGEKDVAVKFGDFKTDNNRLTLDKTKDQLQQSANYQLQDKSTGAGRTASPVQGGHVGSGTSGSSTAPSSTQR